ncbi:type 2 isopentenyl-diphosphate Delta-isomerase [Bacillus salacetis]|uniref:Isopentenyl-diphosphate delta-isomerase n=1 Tax=Bacillus salacetis TaxID=2315464 RepID=A0A3A1RBD1_9BACI|nr:type 2 isopentenyl-diphosphate Delta-isomerase [Bacillus salacetis]RIW38966.1 type 2 isopentenyl-diphosphate Delta-isomerase [Bacillus salacetis]
MTDREKSSTEKRKTEHIDICLTRDVESLEMTTGFEAFRFQHNALPEIDFREIDLGTSIFQKQLKAPFLISSMTGGTETAAQINEALARTAEKHGWAMGVGSMRTAIENEQTAYSFNIRRHAPSIPILANLGAVQFNYGYGVEQCQRAVDLIEADALVLHLNSLQEVFQPEGDTNFKGLLKKIEQAAKSLPVPVGIKEVGMGISSSAARHLYEAGVAFIDVAGSGGTSWIQVEAYRSKEPMRAKAAEAFTEWGIPTAESLMQIRRDVPAVQLYASGGMKNGVHAAKAIALGADLAGFGRSLLPHAAASDEEALDEQFQRIEFELRTAMFGIGAASLSDLKGTEALRRLI